MSPTRKAVVVFGGTLFDGYRFDSKGRSLAVARFTTQESADDFENYLALVQPQIAYDCATTDKGYFLFVLTLIED